MKQTVIRILSAAAACAISSASLASGETITVNLALDDFMDFGGAQRVADLPGPDGGITLREAVTAANNTPGPQTIRFAIPTSEWWFLYNDRAIVRLEMMLQLTDPCTTIDFASQTAFTGNTNPNGNEVGLYYMGPPAWIPSIWVMADGCTIQGLDVGLGNNFGNTTWITGNSNRVIGCTTNGVTIRGDYGGGDNNTLGGTAPGEGNTFTESVVIMSDADANTVVGNRIRWGIQVIGDPGGLTADGTRIGGPSAAERNRIAGRGSYAGEGTPSGTQVDVQNARDTIIENNFIGTTDDGMAKYPGYSGAAGVGVSTGAVGTVVRNNVVSGFEMTGVNHAAGQRFGTAIGVSSNASGTVITGNIVGLGVDGATPILNVDGIVVASDATGVPVGTRIGGSAPGEANSISTGERGGVRVLYSATGVRITRNAIFGNGGLGIDLAGTLPLGVTPNDPLDADVGGNGLQNFPVIDSAQTGAGTVTVTGSLSSAANAAYSLEFFAGPSCDSSGYGEGRQFVGAVTVQTNPKGRADFAATLAAAVPTGWMVTATATALSTLSTSEFSACSTAVAAAACTADLNGDGSVNAPDIAALLSNWGGSGTGDLDGNGTVNAQDVAALLSAWGACP